MSEQKTFVVFKSDPCHFFFAALGLLFILMVKTLWRACFNLRETLIRPGESIVLFIYSVKLRCVWLFSLSGCLIPRRGPVLRFDNTYCTTEDKCGNEWNSTVAIAVVLCESLQHGWICSLLLCFKTQSILVINYLTNTVFHELFPLVVNESVMATGLTRMQVLWVCDRITVAFSSHFC